MNYRKLCLSLAFTFLAFTGGHKATAADIFDGSYTHNWAGVYAGLHGGGAWSDADVSRGSASPATTPGSSINGSGSMFGLLAGINFQSDHFVYGLEGDISFGDVDDSNTVLTNFDVDTIGTIRVRAGYAIDRILIFGTAGIGFAGSDGNETSGQDSNTHTGFVYGAGVEVALTQQLSVRGEYLRGNYNDKKYGFPLAVPHTHTIDYDADVLRAAVVWKFGGIPGLTN